MLHSPEERTDFPVALKNYNKRLKAGKGPVSMAEDWLYFISDIHAAFQGELSPVPVRSFIFISSHKSIPRNIVSSTFRVKQGSESHWLLGKQLRTFGNHGHHLGSPTPVLWEKMPTSRPCC